MDLRMFRSMQLAIGGTMVIASLLFASCSKDLGAEGQTLEQEMVSYSIPSSYVPGELFVKLSDDATAVTKAGASISDAMSGNHEIDQILVEKGVIRFERLFPDSGRFEERTHAAGLDSWFVAKFDKSVDSKAVAKALADCAGVLFVEAPSAVSIPVACSAPSVAYRGSTASAAVRSNSFPFNESAEARSMQWHYNNPGKVGAYATRKGADANVWSAWNYCLQNNLAIGTPDVVVAVIDQGVMYNHEDLAANMWKNPGEIPGNGIDDDGNGYVDDIYGYNFTENKATPSFSSRLNHGTHVAGVIAAVNNNGTGINGIAGGSGSGKDGVRIMTLQAIGQSEQGSSSGLGGIVRAMKYAADNGAVVCQNSWGYTGQVSKMAWDRSAYSALKDAMNYFIEYAGVDENGVQTGPMKGGIILFATGNEGKNEICYPAAADNCVSVSSISYYGDHAYYTNFGPWVDMCAPGGEMTWDDAGGVYSTSVGENGESDYCFLQGTSMACPHVSGACALAVSYYWQKYGKGLTPAMLRSALLSSTQDIDSWMAASYIGKMGIGTLDTYNLLRALEKTAAAASWRDEVSIAVGSTYVIDLNEYFVDASAVRYHGFDSSVISVKVASGMMTITGEKSGVTSINISDAAATQLRLNITVK